MALTKEQEQLVLEIAAHIPEQADKDAIIRVMTDNEAVRGYALRQSDYDRNMNRLKAELKEKEDAAEAQRKQFETLYTQNQEWREKYGTELTGLRTEKQGWETEREKLERQVREAAARGGNEEGGVKQEEVQKLIDDKIKALGGIPTGDALTKLINDTVTQVATAKENEFIEKSLPLQTAFAMDCARVETQHMLEFGGKTLDRPAFSKFCKDNQINDPIKGYEEFVKPQREEAKTAKEKAEREAWEAAERKRIEEEVRKTQLQTVPGSGAVPTGEMGPVQAALEARRAGAGAGGGDKSSIPAGSGWAAAATEARTAGKV